ncbi:hypothetical protein BT96DRAFT_938938 [Gymnopus androsaceus JB14]|uniref:Uncharacterized protein n=1 Tax=Gymnopus androsaceus JB14 TaxID=1447944 RepID=A0A6A4HPX6_9AGAR|nr:hypothetical protein BT96DRAFT_938938 [Gymnopus androsaceus JB14]
MKFNTAIFASAASILFSAATHVSATATPVLTARDSLPTLYNGQNISFEYSDIIVSGSNLFGIGCQPYGEATPSNLFAADEFGASEWDATTVLGIYDYDLVNATYVLQFPFFDPGTAYTVSMFEYDITTGAVVRANLKNQSFIWVNRPGQED